MNPKSQRAKPLGELVQRLDQNKRFIPLPLPGIDCEQLERVAEHHLGLSLPEFVAECVQVMLNRCDPEHGSYEEEMYAFVREAALKTRKAMRLQEAGAKNGGAR